MFKNEYYCTESLFNSFTSQPFMAKDPTFELSASTHKLFIFTSKTSLITAKANGVDNPQICRDFVVNKLVSKVSVKND